MSHNKKQIYARTSGAYSNKEVQDKGPSREECNAAMAEYLAKGGEVERLANTKSRLEQGIFEDEDLHPIIKEEDIF